jgi:uncharacterized membrane protein
MVSFGAYQGLGRVDIAYQGRVNPSVQEEVARVCALASLTGWRKTMRLITTLALSAALSIGAVMPSQAAAGMADETDINKGLLIAAIAEKIQRECDTIGGRVFKARAYLNSLKDMANERGYSDAEIEAYINDDHEKAKMRAKRNAYFKSKGASNLDPESLCVLGHKEIAANSQIGSFLRAK